MEEMTTQPEAIVPVPPKGIEPEDLDKIQSEVNDLSSEMLDNLGDPSLMRQVSAFGSKAQTNASTEIALLKTPMKRMMEDTDSDLPKNLLHLRQRMDELNPHPRMEQIKKASGWWGKIKAGIGLIPKVGDVLKEISDKYESVEAQIDAIIAGLRRGQDQLLQDNLELESLYKNVKLLDRQVMTAAYKGELLWQALEQKLAETEDPGEQRKLKMVISKVATRVQDLKVMEQVFNQFYSSINMVMDNNQNLGDAISRDITLSRPLLTIGLTLQLALQNQKETIKAVNESRAYMSDMLVQNAEAIGSQAEEIGELMNNPILHMEKVAEAYDKMLEAMDTTERIKTEGTEIARKNIGQLEGMTKELRQRVEAQESAKQIDTGTEPKKLEG